MPVTRFQTRINDLHAVLLENGDEDSWRSEATAILYEYENDVFIPSIINMLDDAIPTVRFRASTLLLNDFYGETALKLISEAQEHLDPQAAIKHLGERYNTTWTKIVAASIVRLGPTAVPLLIQEYATLATDAENERSHHARYYNVQKQIDRFLAPYAVPGSDAAQIILALPLTTITAQAIATHKLIEQGIPKLTKFLYTEYTDPSATTVATTLADLGYYDILTEWLSAHPNSNYDVDQLYSHILDLLAVHKGDLSCFQHIITSHNKHLTAAARTLASLGASAAIPLLQQIATLPGTPTDPYPFFDARILAYRGLTDLKEPIDPTPLWDMLKRTITFRRQTTRDILIILVRTATPAEVIATFPQYHHRDHTYSDTLLEAIADSGIDSEKVAEYLLQLALLAEKAWFEVPRNEALFNDVITLLSKMPHQAAVPPLERIAKDKQRRGKFGDLLKACQTASNTW